MTIDENTSSFMLNFLGHVPCKNWPIDEVWSWENQVASSLPRTNEWLSEWRRESYVSRWWRYQRGLFLSLICSQERKEVFCLLNWLFLSFFGKQAAEEWNGVSCLEKSLFLHLETDSPRGAKGWPYTKQPSGWNEPFHSHTKYQGKARKGPSNGMDQSSSLIHTSDTH